MDKHKVAFVCVHNSCRSQMAEAICKALCPDDLDAYSAGTEPADTINQDAVEIIKELYGVDMAATQKPKHISSLPPIDIVITMGCNVGCPWIPARHRDDWGLEDPTSRGREAFIATAKLIASKVKDLRQRINQSDSAFD
jgi:arsenate reductase (thioredoxin)